MRRGTSDRLRTETTSLTKEPIRDSNELAIRRRRASRRPSARPRSAKRKRSRPRPLPVIERRKTARMLAVRPRTSRAHLRDARPTRTHRTVMMSATRGDHSRCMRVRSSARRAAATCPRNIAIGSTRTTNDCSCNGTDHTLDHRLREPSDRASHHAGESVAFAPVGNSSTKMQPLPGRFCTRMLPPCAFTACLAIANPSPNPP